MGDITTEQIPEEQEVLGSVTHSVDTQNGQKTFPVTLRTSARVSKKLRLDSQIASAQEKQPEKKAEKPDVKGNVTSQPNVSKRVNGLWSAEDKNVFFKALNEYGKDFVAIQTHMNNKRKKRGISQNIAKNKDQARHFYYRTWHKISKYVKFPSDVKKATQELYGLINFGEFRKRLGFLSEKYAVKLNELIYSGTTQMRVRGKTVRIKTPVCRALRKLNQLEECPEDVKLPTRVTVELRPKDNHTWSRVQSLSMNPRIRSTLPLHCRLISLIEYLQNKWQPPDHKTKIKASGSNIVNGESTRIGDAIISLLRVAPREGVNIVAPSIGVGEFVTSSRISLLSHEEKFGSGSNAIAEMLKQLNVAAPRGQKSNKNIKKPILDEEKSMKSVSESETSIVQRLDDSFEPDNFVTMTVQQLLALNNEKEVANKSSADDSETSPGKDDFEAIDHITEITTSEKKEEIVVKAKAGWTTKNADLTRIGDLYLMFGSNGKLQLEYWWEEPNQITDVSNILRKLLSIAKTTCDKDKVLCPCGHICKSNGKVGSTSRSKTVAKTLKNNTADLKHSSQNENPVKKTVGEVIGQDALVHQEVSVSSKRPAEVESFRDQLFKLQPRYLGRRRRIGDRQTTIVPRLVPLFSQSSINAQSASVMTTTPMSSSDIASSSRVNTTAASSRLGYPSPGFVVTTSTSSDDISKNISTIASNPIFSSKNEENIILSSTQNGNFAPISSTSSSNRNQASSSTTSGSSSFLLEQDEDSRLSSCSSLGRFLESAFSSALKPSSKDGLTTSISSSENANNFSSSDLKEKIQDGNISPHWLYSEGSNLSFSSLLAELDHTAAQLTSSSNLIESETVLSDNNGIQFHQLLSDSNLNYLQKLPNVTSESNEGLSSGQMQV